MHQIQPTVGQWYLRPKTGHKFEVIDIDDGDGDGDGMIEIQDDEGALDQIDSDSWFADTLEATDQPQNAIGSFDNIAKPDEADGSDATAINALDTDSLRVTQDEMLAESSIEDDERNDLDLQDDLDEEHE